MSTSTSPIDPLAGADSGPPPGLDAPLLRVEGLSVRAGGRRVVDALDLSIHRGEAMALVGASGSGKSLTALSLLGLLPDVLQSAGRPSLETGSLGTKALGTKALGTGRRGSIFDARTADAPRIEAGHVWIAPRASAPPGGVFRDPVDLLSLDEPGRRAIRGDRIALVPQNPGAALDPLRSIGAQLIETLRCRRPGDAAPPERLSRDAARARALELLESVGLPDPAPRFAARPHQLSGGQRQRVAIALALAGEPELLIADEPTTALDVTLQEQILELLKDLRERLGLALLLVTHDLAVVAQTCERVVVLDRGQKVDEGATLELFRAPRHEATRRLLGAAAGWRASKERAP